MGLYKKRVGFWKEERLPIYMCTGKDPPAGVKGVVHLIERSNYYCISRNNSEKKASSARLGQNSVVVAKQQSRYIELDAN